MLKAFFSGVAALTIVATATVVAAQTQDGPIVTGNSSGETADALKTREAIAYARPLPRGAPSADYPLVAWCDALVTGHADLGDTLPTKAPEDVELVRLGRLEAQDFRSALAVAAPRQSAASKAEAEQAVAGVKAQWATLMSNPDTEARSQSFGLFFGLPGRCEHAARRIRNNVTTPPATLESVGIN